MFEVKRDSRRHEGGTKDYHLVAIKNTDNGRALFVTRWAKASEWGNGLNVEQCAGIGALDRAWAAKEREKFARGGYTKRLPTTSGTYDDVDQLQRVLGPQLWKKLGSNLEWLIPGVGMGDVEPEAEKEWDEVNRRWVRKGGPITKTGDFLDLDAVKAEEEAKAKEDAEYIKTNDQWGSW